MQDEVRGAVKVTARRWTRIYGRSCGTSMEKRPKGRLCRPFVKATARRLCRCFAVRRRRGDAAIESRLNGSGMGRYFIGTIVPDAEDTCGWHPWADDGEGLRDSFLRAYAIPQRRTYETDRRTRNMGRLSVCFLLSFYWFCISLTVCPGC